MVTITVRKDVLEALLEHLEVGITSKEGIGRIHSEFVPVAKKALAKKKKECYRGKI